MHDFTSIWFKFHNVLWIFVVWRLTIYWKGVLEFIEFAERKFIDNNYGHKHKHRMIKENMYLMIISTPTLSKCLGEMKLCMCEWE